MSTSTKKKTERDELREQLALEAALGSTTSNPQLERSIISLVLKSDDAAQVCQSALRRHDFTQEPMRLIYDAAVSIRDTGGTPNVVTVTAHLQSDGKLEDAGGESSLQEISAIEGLDPKQAVSYCRQLKEFSYRRRLQYVAGKLQGLSKSPENSKELSAKVRDLMRHADDHNLPEDAHLNPREIVDRVGLEKFFDPLKDEVWVDTDWDKYNDIMIGYFKGTLNIIAARPSVGKSAFAAQILLRAAMKGIPVLFCSLEMKRESIIRRLVCSIAQVDVRKILRRDLDAVERVRLAQALNQIMDIPLEVTNIYGRTPPEIEMAMRSVQQKHGSVGLVAIDHLQLTRPTRKHPNRHSEIAEVTGAIKLLTLQFDTPMLLLSQLSRLTEKEDRAPKLSDLMESGAIEADADTVTMLHRPELYKRDGDKGKAEAHIRKNRDGMIGSISLRFEPRFVKFENGDDDYDSE